MKDCRAETATAKVRVDEAVHAELPASAAQDPEGHQASVVLPRPRVALEVGAPPLGADVVEAEAELGRDELKHGLRVLGPLGAGGELRRRRDHRASPAAG